MAVAFLDSSVLVSIVLRDKLRIEKNLGWL
jgi:hypothetical protein